MDWAKQMEEMSKTWTEMQKTMWSNWMDTTKGMTLAQTTSGWRQMVDTWQSAVQQMLDAQADGMRIWAENIAASEAPENMVEWAEQLQQMTKAWVKSQRQLWDGWFQIAKNLDPSQMTGNSSLNAQPIMKAWQEMAQNASEIQKEWMKSWASWQPNKQSS